MTGLQELAMAIYFETILKQKSKKCPYAKILKQF